MNNNKEFNNGNISIFALITMLSVVMGFLLLLSISNNYQMEAYLSGKIKLAGNTILSKFDEKLFKNHGILAIKKEYVTERDKQKFKLSLAKDEFSADKLNIKYMKSLENVNLLKSSILNFQKNRFIYNASQSVISKIMDRIDKNDNGEMLNRFNSISDEYENVLDDYQNLNKLLINFRSHNRNMYHKLVSKIYIHELDIINSINSLSKLSNEKSNEEKKNNILLQVQNAAKKVKNEVQKTRKFYMESKEILSEMLNRINLIENKISKIESMINEVEGSTRLAELESILKETARFNNLLSKNSIKNKIKINIQKAKDIIIETKEFSFKYAKYNNHHTVSYLKLSKADYEWIEKNMMGIKVIYYQKIKNTDFIKLSIYQKQVDDVLSNKREIENLVDTIKNLFTNKRLNVEDIEISSNMQKKLYSKNCTGKESSQVIDGIINKLILIDYINENFSDGVNNEVNNNKFFKNTEAEYVLSGKIKSNENIEIAKRKILVLRTGLNLEYVLTTPEMMNFISEISNNFASFHPVLVPIVKVILISTISLAEANIDYNSLIQGASVPILKDKKSWNLNISNLKNLIEKKEYKKNDKKQKGVTYRGYLNILMFLNKENTLVKRIGDLIQLNSNNSSLNFSDYYQKVEIEVVGKNGFFYNGFFTSLRIHQEEDFEY